MTPRGSAGSIPTLAHWRGFKRRPAMERGGRGAHLGLLCWFVGLLLFLLLGRDDLHQLAHAATRKVLTSVYQSFIVREPCMRLGQFFQRRARRNDAAHS